jgi:GNAT superfamily N-acetyltransferase
MTITYRLYRPSDAEQVNDLAHNVFNLAPFSAEVWQHMEEGEHVTVVAAEGDKIVGAIPFDLRDFLIRPGLSIRSAWAHMVCVDAEYRSRGIGSGMMKLARVQLAGEQLAGQHLPRICEAMFVYTGSEGTAPYTFYEKNGFVDLHYSRFFTLTNPKANAPLDVEVTPYDPARIGEENLYAAFQRAYQDYAGFPVHYPGYWQRAIESIIYIEIPTEFYIATLTQETELSGYAVFGFIRGHATLLELAAGPAEPGLIDKLLQAVIAAAAARGVEMVNMLACTHHPAASALLELGFQPDRRANAEVVAGVVLEFDRLWNKLAGENPPFGLEIWTPSRTLKLPGPGKPITLEMKESTLQRLFLCREDLPAALEAERITSPHLSLPLEALQTIFQPAPWVFHWLEWI